MHNSPFSTHANYNKDFAAHVVKAWINSQKTFRFCGKTYKPENHIEGVRRDLSRGCYKFNMSKMLDW